MCQISIQSSCKSEALQDLLNSILFTSAILILSVSVLKTVDMMDLYMMSDRRVTVGTKMRQNQKTGLDIIISNIPGMLLAKGNVGHI